MQGSNFIVTATDLDANLPYSLVMSGDTALAVAGNTATLSGTLGPRAYFQVLDLPASVDTVALQDVPGSIDDETNMQNGLLMHERGYTVSVPGNSMVASGGVDLLAAGVTRIVEDGAMIGVHSWSDGAQDGRDYACDHSAHHGQLCYFETVMGRDAGTAFYFYTLSAAPAAGIHYMTREELIRYGLLDS